MMRRAPQAVSFCVAVKLNRPASYRNLMYTVRIISHKSDRDSRKWFVARIAHAYQSALTSLFHLTTAARVGPYLTTT